MLISMHVFYLFCAASLSGKLSSVCSFTLIPIVLTNEILAHYVHWGWRIFCDLWQIFEKLEFQMSLVMWVVYKKSIFSFKVQFNKHLFCFA